MAHDLGAAGLGAGVRAGVVTGAEAVDCLDSWHDEAASPARKLRSGFGPVCAGRIARVGKRGGQNPGSRRVLSGTLAETGGTVESTLSQD